MKKLIQTHDLRAYLSVFRFDPKLIAQQQIKVNGRYREKHAIKAV